MSENQEEVKQQITNIENNDVKIVRVLIIPIAQITNKTDGIVEGEAEMMQPNGKPISISQRKFSEIPKMLSDMQEQLNKGETDSNIK